MNNVLITGSSGFVGKNLSKYLDNKGYLLNFISLRGVKPPFNLLEINNLVHLAGKAHDLKQVSSSNEYYDVNYKLTRELYDAFLVSDSKKFIFINLGFDHGF